MNELDLGKVVGSQMHDVTAAPAASLGLEGDWAVNPDTGEVYKKGAGGWEKLGSFKGPKGDTGEQGLQGIQGPKGDKGDTGATGETGATGATGPKGADGADGKTPSFSINSSGHLIATYSE